MTIATDLATVRALKKKGDVDGALNLVSALLDRRPDDGTVLLEWGGLLSKAGRHGEAIEALQRAAALLPEWAQPLLVLACAHTRAGEREAAIAVYEQALARAPDDTVGLFNSAVELSASGRNGAAARRFGRLLAVAPGLDAARFGMARAHHALGDLAQAVPLYRDMVARRPDYWQGGCNLLMALLQQGALGPSALLEECRGWARRLTLHTEPPPPEPKMADARLVVGIVSPDLRDHPVGRFLEPVLETVDRARFRLLAYNSNSARDGDTDRLRCLFDGWRDIAALDEPTAAAAIRADGVDILLDLAGHSANNRLPLFALKPARVQVAWLGWPASTGLVAMDARLTDAVADPPSPHPDGPPDSWFTERLVRLPRFLCFRPPLDAPSVAPPPCLTRGHVTFGSFNTLAKLSDRTVALWASLMLAVPDSRLLLKAHAFRAPEAADLTRTRFAAAGVDAGRLDVRPPTDRSVDHLAAYADIDIALDPMPYNGTTTTCEALWMGVPVVSLAGRWHLDRVGAALLNHAGLADLIAASPERFVAMAATLAADPDELAERRTRQRENIALSGLCDVEGFTRALEAALLDLADRHRAVPLRVLQTVEGERSHVSGKN